MPSQRDVGYDGELVFHFFILRLFSLKTLVRNGLEKKNEELSALLST